MPCHNTLCAEHIKILNVDSDTKKFKCLVCTGKHEMPCQSIFPENKTITNMLRMNTHFNEASKGLKYELDNSKSELDTLFNDLFSKSNEFDVESEEYFSNAKKQISIKVENIKVFLEEIEKKMISHVDKCQLESNIKIQELKSTYLNNELSKTRLNELYSSVDNYFRNTKLDLKTLKDVKTVLNKEIKLANINLNKFEAQKKIFFSSCTLKLNKIELAELDNAVRLFKMPVGFFY